MSYHNGIAGGRKSKKVDKIRRKKIGIWGNKDHHFPLNDASDYRGSEFPLLKDRHHLPMFKCEDLRRTLEFKKRTVCMLPKSCYHLRRYIFASTIAREGDQC